MRLLRQLIRRYPWLSAQVAFYQTLGQLVAATGTAALLPTLAVLLDDDRDPAPSSRLERVMVTALARLGLAPDLGVLVLLLIAVAVVRAAIVVPTNRAIGNTVAQVAMDLRIRLVRGIASAKWSHLTKQRVGMIASAFGPEADRAAMAFLAGAGLFSMGLRIVAMLVLAALISPAVTAVGVCAGAFIGFALASFVRTARRAGAKQTRITREALARLSSTLVSLKPLKAMGRDASLGRLFGQDTERLHRILRRLVRTRGTLRAFQEALVTVLIAAVAYGVLRFFAIPFKDLLVLLFVFVRILTSVSKVQRGLQQLAIDESAYYAIDKTISDAEDAVEVLAGRGSHIAPARLREGIAFRSVSQTYDGAPVLRDLDLDIPAGRITALIGPSGSGKTTIADLVCGLLEKEAGALTIDGVPFEEIDLRDWRGKVGYVAQDTRLLHGSVVSNLGGGDGALTPSDIERALACAQATEFVSELPEGLETSLGVGGALLSGGQRQRIAIAKALVRRPALLILDEATSALDPETERALFRALRDYDDGLTILAISHQENLLEVADHVVEHRPLPVIPVYTAASGAPEARSEGIR